MKPKPRLRAMFDGVALWAAGLYVGASIGDEMPHWLMAVFILTVAAHLSLEFYDSSRFARDRERAS